MCGVALCVMEMPCFAGSGQSDRGAARPERERRDERVAARHLLDAFRVDGLHLHQRPVAPPRQ